MPISVCNIFAPAMMGGCIAAVVSMMPAATMAQRGRPALQRAALDTNTEVVKRLATVEDHIKERQWAQAILILQQVAVDEGDSLIEISPRRYLNVATYCNSVLANLPPEGLAVYREKYDAQAQQWLEMGLATRNPALLEKITRQSFISSSGDDALYWLGEWAWDRGEFAAARDYWRQLLQLQNPPEVGEPQSVLRYPDSSHAQPLVLARIVLCHIFEGHSSLAQSWLGYLAEKYPAARGELAGRKGPYADILKEVIQEAGRWQFPQPAGDFPTFAGNPQRNLIAAKQPELGGVQWELPLPDHRHNPSSPRMPMRETSLSFYPAVANNTVFLCDPDRIYAFDLLTGRAKWPLAGDGQITQRKDLELATIYQTTKQTQSNQEFRVGVPRYTLTIHEDRLYARMGSPVTGRQASQRTLTLNSHVVCLDLKREGKILWTCRPRDVLANAAEDGPHEWAFEGTPVAEGGRVYVALRQSHPQTGAAVACLDAETGKPQWVRRVASALANLAEAQNFISHHLLTLGENMVFFMPEFGAVTALHARDGRLMWAVTYPSLPPKESPTLKDPRKQGLTPPLFHQGVLYAAPTDSESVLAIAAKSGVILWEQKIPFKQDHIQHVLGVVPREQNGELREGLVLSGNELWILDAKTGNIDFPAQFTPGRHPEYDGYGRGAIAGEQIYFPTRSAIEIRSFTGRRSEQPKPLPGGNLAVAGDLLLIAESERLVAYSNFAQLKEAQEKLLSELPKSARPRLRLAQIEEASGESLKALEHYEQAIALATSDDMLGTQPLKALAVKNRFRLLMRLGEGAIEKRILRVAVGHFQNAARHAPDSASRAGALQLLGKTQIQLGESQPAVKTFQSLLDDPELAELPMSAGPHRSYGDFAHRQIAELIGQHGREVYAEFDRLAGEELDRHLKQKDLPEARAVLRRFPNAAVGPEALHQIAVLSRDKGAAWQALASWRQLLEAAIPPKTRQAVLLEMSRTLDRQQYFHRSSETWRQLAREFPNMRMTAGGETAAKFVPAHLRSDRYRQAGRQSPRLPLTRRWQRDVTKESRIMIPQGEPPGPSLTCALMDDRGVVCVDSQTGETRWQKQLDDRAAWAGYGWAHLLIGTAKSVHAVTLETGRSLWSFSLNDPDEAAEPGPPRFHSVGGRVLVLQPSGVCCLDATSGEVIWNDSPSGRLSETWYADGEFVIVETRAPLRVLVIDSETGEQLSEHRFSAPWTSPPVRLGSPAGSEEGAGFAVSLGNRRIRAFSAHDAQADPNWIYGGATSHANTDPRLWSESGQLMLLMDGDTLIQLAPATGKTLWYHAGSTALAHPRQSLALAPGRVYVAQDKMLHCFETPKGRHLWKRRLPGAGEWAIRKTGPFLLALPWKSDNADSRAVLLDADTGDRVQEISLPARILDSQVHPAGLLIIAEEKLVGLGPLEFFPAAN